MRNLIVFSLMTILLLMTGFLQSWSLMLSIFNLCILSAIMALGVNIQWGYAGLFNVGIMGFAALGGLSVVLISKKGIDEAITLGGGDMLVALLLAVITIILSIYIHRRISNKFITILVVIVGYSFARHYYTNASVSIESVSPSLSGYLGGFGLPVMLSWIVGGMLAALAAWFIGKISLGLRSDYLAIATLGISEIIISLIKNEDWLTRGVKNVTAIPRPVPYEFDLQQATWFQDLIAKIYANKLVNLTGDERLQVLVEYINEASIIFVKLCYAGLFLSVLVLFVILANLALNSPWGRMVRAVRDNEVAASAMGKDVKRLHLQIFIIGSAIVGIAGAMLVTYDGQFTPGAYNPLRYTFLIWVMVIIGGSGNNLGSVIGGFLIWFIWIEAEPMGFWLMEFVTSFMSDDSLLKQHLLDSAQYMRLILMGMMLLLVMRFSPNGILPEINKKL